MTTVEPTFEDLARAVDTAAAKVRQLDESVRGPAEELQRAVEAVHRAGLLTMVRRLRADAAGRELLFELVDDPTVRLLLSLHGIIRIDQLPPPAAPEPKLIPLRPVNWRDEPGWVKTRPAAEIPEGMVASLRLATRDGTETDAVVVNAGGRLSAYRDACAHQGLPLGGALVDPVAGTLTCPWHGYCYDALSGECLSAPGARLDPLPLRVDGGDVWIRVGP